MNLPSGTVTFLFTDIEGSTRLWEEQRETMRAALARHDALLREAIESRGGAVFKTIGDSFCAAFPTPTAAVAAARSAQQTLAREESGAEAEPLRVRMALHTGVAEERGEEYFGPPLNRVSRLLAAAHGGQVLLSGATQELVRDALPGGVALRDLGEHRLKDLARPERVFQLVAPELPTDFPPLRALDLHPHNLPVQPTPLIGRESELREILERLREEARLLTLTGPGGTGKTRLALQAAAELVESFRDGVFFVNLGLVTDPARVSSTIAQTLGLKEGGERSLGEMVREHLRKREMLLLLDNFEQLIEAAPVVSDLLAAAPGLKVLATSRVPLHLRGEQECAVPPLDLPDRQQRLTPERLGQYEAVRLFIERARAVRPDFAVTNENAPAVAEICHRLDGLPLALELAAARIKLLQPQALLARLESRLKLLTGGARDLPRRHQTLRGAIAWSHELLEEGEQGLFRRLAVFTGGCTLEAIEIVCDPGLELDALEGATALVNQSLLRQENGVDGEPRFVMLETIHEFADEKLEECGEAGEMQSRHAAHFLALAEAAEAQLNGPEQVRWLRRLEEEHENLRAALRRSLVRGDAPYALRLASALQLFWHIRGYLSEGRQWLGEALAAGAPDLPEVRAKALYGAGVLARYQADLEAARAVGEESLALYRSVDDAAGAGAAVNLLGIVADQQGDAERAEEFFEESLQLKRRIGDQRGVAVALNNLGMIAYQRGDDDRAAGLFEESLALRRELGNTGGIGKTLGNLGEVARRRGDYARAGALYRESLRVHSTVGNRYGSAIGLADLAGVAGAQGQPLRAARLYGAAEALFALLGAHVEPASRADYDRALAAARAQLDAAAWEQGWQEGADMPLEEAIAYALQEDQGSRSATRQAEP